MTKWKNNTGYYRVYKSKCPNCSQGFVYKYRWYDENKKQKSISSVNIRDLEVKVKKRNLPWKTIKEVSEITDDLAFFNVSKYKCKQCEKGYMYAYSYYENGKRKRITSVSLRKLRDKVKAKDLTWEKLA